MLISPDLGPRVPFGPPPPILDGNLDGVVVDLGAGRRVEVVMGVGEVIGELELNWDTVSG